MPINVEPKYFPPDGLPANNIIIAAIILKKDVASLVNNVMEAVWVKEKDIGRTDVIIEEQDIFLRVKKQNCGQTFFFCLNQLPLVTYHYQF